MNLKKKIEISNASQQIHENQLIAAQRRHIIDNESAFQSARVALFTVRNLIYHLLFNYTKIERKDNKKHLEAQTNNNKNYSSSNRIAIV